MDGFEAARRDFLRKLGLTVGAGMVLSTAKISAKILDPKEARLLTPEQQTLMGNYEQWMDEFIVVIRRQKEAPDDLKNNRRIVALSETAKGWQKELSGYMNDENFARYFMTVSERMTKEIEA